GDPAVARPRELRAGGEGHGALHDRAGRHGQHLGRAPGRGAALLRAGDPALHGGARAALDLRPLDHRARGHPHAALRARDGGDDAGAPGGTAALGGAQARIDGARMSAAASPILAVAHVSKHFGGLTALSDVSFAINAGEIYGLIGPNGAGKTTLFNVLTGIYPQDEGRFHFEGKLLHRPTPDRIAALGIARTFQNIRLFANLSALENVMIGRHVRTHAGVVGAILRSPRTRAEEAAIV